MCISHGRSISYFMPALHAVFYFHFIPFHMGIGGTFANAIRKALNSVVPKKLWPKIKKRLRFAFNQRGEVILRVPVETKYHLTTIQEMFDSASIKFLLRNLISGIRLPVICGVELERPSLTYIDHAIVIDTDFRLFFQFPLHSLAFFKRETFEELLKNKYAMKDVHSYLIVMIYRGSSGNSKCTLMRR